MRHLPKTLGLTAALVVMTGLMALSGAQADSVLPFSDTTLVQPFIGTGPGSGAGYNQNQLYDVIGIKGGVPGQPNGYDTSAVNVEWYNNTSLRFIIYTNYPKGGGAAIESGDPSFAADLWLKDSNTNNLYGVALTTHGSFIAGDLYKDAGFLNANAQPPLNSGGWVYGGAYSTDGTTLPAPNTNLTPTLLNAGTFLASGSLSWGPNTDPDTIGTYKVVVDLGAVNTGGAFDQFSFFWGTGNCSNDAIFGAADVVHSTPQGAVPVPASVLLLGTGLLGLAGLRWRRRQES